MSKYSDPSGKTIKAIFEDYAGELFCEKYKELVAKLKEPKHFPYGYCPGPFLPN